MPATPVMPATPAVPATPATPAMPAMPAVSAMPAMPSPSALAHWRVGSVARWHAIDSRLLAVALTRTRRSHRFSRWPWHVFCQPFRSLSRGGLAPEALASPRPLICMAPKASSSSQNGIVLRHLAVAAAPRALASPPPVSGARLSHVSSPCHASPRRARACVCASRVSAQHGQR